MPMNPYRVFRRPLLTEKTTALTDKYTERPGGRDLIKYSFEVDPQATKDDIRHAMESLFPESQGNILKINTIRMRSVTKDPDKSRRIRRYRPGRTTARKKAVVTLRGGVSIPQFDGI